MFEKNIEPQIQMIPSGEKRKSMRRPFCRKGDLSLPNTLTLLITVITLLAQRHTLFRHQPDQPPDCAGDADRLDYGRSHPGHHHRRFAGAGLRRRSFYWRLHSAGYDFPERFSAPPSRSKLGQARKPRWRWAIDSDADAGDQLLGTDRPVLNAQMR